jgi:hypothetical protein
LVTRPQSKFNYLSTEQFQEGLARLAAAAQSEPLDKPVPVDERYDVAVFARQGALPPDLGHGVCSVRRLPGG